MFNYLGVLRIKINWIRLDLEWCTIHAVVECFTLSKLMLAIISFNDTSNMSNATI